MQNINVNIVPDSYPQTIRYSQGDVGREFKINVVGFTIPTGAIVKIQATKPSGFGFSVAGTVADNAVSFTTTAIMTDEAGRFPAELEITKDSVVIGTANFIMWGEANPHPEGTTDGQQGTIIPELTLLVERVEAAASSILDMEVVANTLPAGSQATYSYDEDLNKATFGIPQGEAGAGAAGVVADAYSSSKTYKVGDYVLHNSNLYRCTTAITTAEAFTAAHWTQIVLANDVSDLKTDLSILEDNMFEFTQKSVASSVSSYGMNTDGSSYSSNARDLVRYAVKPGELLKVHITGENAAGLWGFFKYTGVIPSNVIGSVYTKNTDGFFVVPANAQYLILSKLKESTENVIYSCTTIREEEDAQIKNDVKNIKAGVGDYVKLSSFDFQNGSWESGSGFVNSTTRLRLKNQTPIKVGTVINFKPNGQYFALEILESPTATTAITFTSFSNEDFTYVSSYNSYLSVLIRKADNSTIVPSDFVGDITVDSTRFLEIEKSISNLNEKVANIKVKTKNNVVIKETCQSVSGWSNPFGSPAPTLDTENYLLGNASIHSTYVAQKNIGNCDLTENDLVLKLKVNSLTEGAKLRLYLSDTSSFSSFYVYDLFLNHSTKPFDFGEWVEVTVPLLAYSESSGTPNAKKINTVRIRHNSGQVDYNIQYIGLRKKALSKGVVTFTFDDGYSSQLDGCKILASKGVSGTVFAIADTIERGVEGFLTKDDCYSIKYECGCDIECHGSEVYTGMTDEELNEHFAATKEWLKNNSLGDGKYLAYVGGASDKRVVKVARKYFDSCRTIYDGVPIETYPPCDYHRVRAVSAISSANGGTSIAKVKNLIDMVEQNKSWLILVFHRLGTVSSTMDCSISDFTDIVDYVLSKDVEIRDYSQMF